MTVIRKVSTSFSSAVHCGKQCFKRGFFLSYYIFVLLFLLILHTFRMVDVVTSSISFVRLSLNLMYFIIKFDLSL